MRAALAATAVPRWQWILPRRLQGPGPKPARRGSRTLETCSHTKTNDNSVLNPHPQTATNKKLRHSFPFSYGIGGTLPPNSYEDPQDLKMQPYLEKESLEVVELK